jgi:hypothetical protein
MLKRIFLTASLVLMTALCSAAWQGESDIPRHHDGPPPRGENLAPIMTPDQIKVQGFMLPQQIKAYEMAAKVPNTLYQMPCYCRCDRSVGHESLRSCFESAHGAHCSTCMQEAIFAYQQQKAGKSVKQIRAAIERGEFQQVDLSKVASIR